MPETRTFLFTDIEGSTKRWEQYPQQMQAALARHDALLRTVIEANGGYVFKTVGDAFCAAFPIPHQALSAALDAQRALLDYFANIRTLREDSPAAARCTALIVQATPLRIPAVGAQWTEAWRGSRPGDRHELFILYRRE